MIAGVVSKIVPFLNSLLPSAIAVKGLSKIDPRFSKFFTNAAAAGFGTDQAISYLRNKFKGSGEEGYQQNLNQRVSSGLARPDEASSLQQIQSSQRIPNSMQKGVSLAAGIGAGMSGMEDAPQEQKKPLQIGTDQAISPTAIEDLRNRGGSAPTGALEMKDGTKLQNEKVGSSGPSISTHNREVLSNAFQKFMSDFPQLGTALDKHMSSGMSIADAVKSVRSSKTLKSIVDRIEKDMGQPLENMLMQLLGESQPPTGDSALISAIDKILNM